MLRIAALSFFLFSSHAFGGVFIEPYVGYYKGEVDYAASITSPIVADTKGSADQDGVAFGGKIGFNVAGLALGVDYMHIGGESTDKSDGETSKDKIDNVGAFISVPLLSSVRLSGTYFFSSKAKDSESEVTGTGYKVGLGFNMFWRVNLNVEHIVLTFDEAKADNVVFSKYNAESTVNMISLSLPLGE